MSCEDRFGEGTGVGKGEVPGESGSIALSFVIPRITVDLKYEPHPEEVAVA